jgi:hypothetical protein
MICVQGSLSIGLTSFSQSGGGATFAITNWVQGGAGSPFTANEYILLGGITASSASQTITAVFSSAPGTGTSQPILWLLECVPNFSQVGSYFVDANGSSPFQSFNVTPGSNVILFNPGGQYPNAGEMFVFHEQASVAATGVTGAGYSSSQTATAPLGQSISASDYSNANGAVTTNLSGSGNVMGLGCVFKYQFADIPECIPAMGVM